MEKMRQFYDDECKRLGIGKLDAPKELVLKQEEYDWYLSEIAKTVIIGGNQSLIDRVINHEQPLLFRGVEVKPNEKIAA